MLNSHFTISPDSDDVSVVARMAGENMVSRLELMTLQPEVILEAGHCSELLKKYYPHATFISHNENISLSDHSVDFIFANFFLPWCDQWEKIFLEWRRILRPNGLLMFTCLGVDTLKELSSPLGELPQLKDMHEIGDTLLQTKFSDPVMDVEYVKLNYRDKGLAITYEVIYGHAFGPEKSMDYSADEQGIVKIPLTHLRNWRRE